MKREILFRGRTKLGKWITGMPTYNMQFIFNDDNLDSPDNYEVDPETVGQLWYVSEKIKCFDGDLFEADAQLPFERKYNKRIILIDSFGRGVRYWIVINCIKHAPKLVDWSTAKLIGNIHDNPELLN